MLVHFAELVQTLTDSFVIDPSSILLREGALDVIQAILNAVGGAGTAAAIESHFLSTGRLTSMHKTLQKCFESFILDLSTVTLQSKALQALYQLASLETPSINEQVAFDRMFAKRGSEMLSKAITSFEFSDAWSTDSLEYKSIDVLLECPLCFLSKSTDDSKSSMHTIIIFLQSAVRRSEVARESKEVTLSAVAKTLLCVLRSVLGLPHVGNRRYRESMKVYNNEESSAALPDLESMMDSVLETFVLNSSWAISTNTQRLRLDLLSLLTGGQDGEVSGFFNVDILVRYSQKVICAVLSPGKNPSNPVELRSLSIDLTRKVLLLLRNHLIDDDGCVRVQEIRDDKSVCMVNTSGPLSVERFFPASAVEAMICVVHLLSEMIDDCDDTIRDTALHSLNLIIILIPRSALTMSITEINLIKNLLRILDERLGEDQVRERVDTIIRTIATIDPEQTESVVRECLSKGKNCDEYVHFCSDLIGHCDLLSKFKECKNTKKNQK